MSEYEEVVTYDDDGEVVDSYVERVIDSGPYAGEDPPDDYYDERPEDESVPSWGTQPIEEPCAKIGCGKPKSEHAGWALRHLYAESMYSMEPPF
ncbi:hypothetical protein ACIQUZ_35595 [Streptomyces griseus]|uniref:hypothetical protein n=1 Tax=Streptomyces griseus TaxID=1911 RepID=UPI003814E1C5